MNGIDGRIRIALSAQKTGRHEEAVASIEQVFEGRQISGAELAEALRVLAPSASALGLHRAEAAICLYRGELARAERASRSHPIDRARHAIASGDAHRAAAELHEAGWLGHAALQLEGAGDPRGARQLWEALDADRRLHDELYTRGLVCFNLARACKLLGDHGASRRARIRSVHYLEAAADGFETRGLRERAFDCFQVLLSMGSAGAFENLAEGYLGCIRILASDNLKHYVLQYYEDFAAMALKADELLAASTIFGEAAEYATRHRMPYADHYRLHAGKTLMLVAAKAAQDASNAPMAENAYGAAIEAFADLGAFTLVREAYARLSRLPLAEKRTARYARLGRRYEGVPDEIVRDTPFPEHLRVPMAYPEVWRADIIEWEQAGDPAEAMAEIALDTQRPTSTRERALVAQLRWLMGRDDPPNAATAKKTARDLGRVEVYASIAPLERLYESVDADVRRAVIKALGGLYFKRSFVTIIEALDDADPAVRTEALAAVSALRFAHALDPLQRIYRSAQSTEARRAALESIGRIPTLDAADVLLNALLQGAEWERQLASSLLRRRNDPDLRAMLERAALEESGPAKVAIETVLGVGSRSTS